MQRHFTCTDGVWVGWITCGPRSQEEWAIFGFDGQTGVSETWGDASDWPDALHLVKKKQKTVDLQVRRNRDSTAMLGEWDVHPGRERHRRPQPQGRTPPLPPPPPPSLPPIESLRSGRVASVTLSWC